MLDYIECVSFNILLSDIKSDIDKVIYKVIGDNYSYIDRSLIKNNLIEGSRFLESLLCINNIKNINIQTGVIDFNKEYLKRDFYIY
jgi:hypothetical protein